MDLNRDEIRRQLREADELQGDAIGPWRRALDRLFDSGEKFDTTTKAHVLGVPDRRQFMKIGSATVVGAAVLAACGSSNNAKPQITGTTTATSTPGTAAPAAESADDKKTDLTLLRTATSIELLAVAVYDKAIASGLVTTAAIGDAAKLFRDQHKEHAGLLQSATSKAGGQPYKQPNDYLNTNVVMPALKGLKSEMDVVKFAKELEDVAAATYTLAGGILGTPDLRAAIMSIGGVEAKHVAVLNLVLASNDLTMGVPDPFYKTTDAVGSAAYVS